MPATSTCAASAAVGRGITSSICTCSVKCCDPGWFRGGSETRDSSILSRVSSSDQSGDAKAPTAPPNSPDAKGANDLQATLTSSLSDPARAAIEEGVRLRAEAKAK